MSRTLLPTLLMLLGAPAPAVADWLFDASAGLTAYDNVGRSRNKVDYRSATALEVAGAALFQPAWQTEGVVTFDLSGGIERYDRFDGLDRVRVSAGAAYYDKLGLGAGAPWWSASASVGHVEYRDALRSGPTFQAGLSSGRAWDNGFDLRGGLTWSRHDGGREAFELASVRANLDGDYRLSPRWAVFSTVAWLRGDITASTTDDGNFGPTAFPDPVFGAAWRSYRVDSDIITFTLGGTYDLGATTQLLLAWDRLDGEARRFDAPYDGTIVRAQIRHEF